MLDRSKSHAVAPLLAHFDSCFAPSCPLRLARLGGHACLCLLASLRASHRAPRSHLCSIAPDSTLSRSPLLARFGPHAFALALACSRRSHAIAGSRWASRLPALTCFSRPRYHLRCLVTGSRSPRWLASFSLARSGLTCSCLNSLRRLALGLHLPLLARFASGLSPSLSPLLTRLGPHTIGWLAVGITLAFAGSHRFWSLTLARTFAASPRASRCCPRPR